MTFEELSEKIKPDSVLRKRFGEFLVAQNIVPAEAIEKALAHQKKQAPVIGKLAHTHKLMTSDEICQVLNKQQVDKRRFGDLAVELGFLSDTQVKGLLKKQQQLRPKIGESLVVINELDHPTLNEQLDKFLKR